MKSLAVIAAFVLFLTPGAVAEDFTGKWSGTFAVVLPDGSSHDDSIEMNLTHKGNELTGTAGPNAERQWPVSKGVVDGNKLTFMVQSDGPLVSFVLTFADGRLKGTASGEEGGQKLTAKVDAGRAK